LLWGLGGGVESEEIVEVDFGVGLDERVAVYFIDSLLEGCHENKLIISTNESIFQMQFRLE
jgi:hypothetical protein